MTTMYKEAIAFKKKGYTSIENTNQQRLLFNGQWCPKGSIQDSNLYYQWNRYWRAANCTNAPIWKVRSKNRTYFMWTHHYHHRNDSNGAWPHCLHRRSHHIRVVCWNWTNSFVISWTYERSPIWATWGLSPGQDLNLHISTICNNTPIQPYEYVSTKTRT